MIQIEKRDMYFAMIGTSAIIVIVGLYIGLILKDVILLAATLAVIELFTVLIVEISGISKDRLSKKEKELTKFLDIQKLKRQYHT